jgi:hypothetical protein
MPRPSRRAVRNAAIAATIMVGMLVFSIQAIFHPSSAWRWLWIPYVSLWFGFFMCWFEEFGKLEILFHLDRGAAKDEAAKQ